jgi:ankyrin repeat protein
LNEAAKRGRDEMIALLLQNVCLKSIDINIPFLSAIEYGNKDTALLLIHYGANIETRDREMRTALIIAAENGNEELTESLINHNASIEAKNSKGWTALITASYYGFLDVVMILLNNGAELENSDNVMWFLLVRFTILIVSSFHRMAQLHYLLHVNNVALS